MRDDYLLTEPPFKAILLFSLPMMLGNFFQQFYTMADSVIVGRFVGENTLASVGASYALTIVFISIASIGNLTLRVAGAFLLAPHFGVEIVWYIIPLGWSIYFIICYLSYRSGRWRKALASC